MHDDVRTLVQQAAERIDPPPADLGTVRRRVRRTVVRSAAASALVVALVAAAAWALDFADLAGDVSPARRPITTLASRPVEVMSFEDERRPRDELVVVTPQGTVRRSLPSDVAARWGLPQPAPGDGVRHIGTDCVKWRDAASEARYCAYRYEIQAEADRKKDYRDMLVQGWSRGRSSGLGLVRLGVRVDLTRGRNANVGYVVPPWATGIIDGGGCTTLHGDDTTPGTFEVEPVRVCGDAYGVRGWGDEWGTVEWRGDAPPGRRIPVRAAVEWALGDSKYTGFQGYELSLWVEHRAP